MFSSFAYLARLGCVQRPTSLAKMHNVKGVQFVNLWRMISSVSLSFQCSIVRQACGHGYKFSNYCRACVYVLLVLMVGHAVQQHTLGANNGLIGAALRLHHSALKISVLTLLNCQTDRCYEALWAPTQYVQTILVGCAPGRWESGLYIGLSLMRLCSGLALVNGFALGWH